MMDYIHASITRGTVLIKYTVLYHVVESNLITAEYFYIVIFSDKGAAADRSQVRGQEDRWTQK